MMGFDYRSLKMQKESMSHLEEEKNKPISSISKTKKKISLSKHKSINKKGHKLNSYLSNLATNSKKESRL